jgi:hypothetical protein
MGLVGWTKFEKGILDSQVFCHPEDVRIYLWISCHAMVKDGVRVGDRVLEKGQFVQSISVIQDKLWFYNGKKKDVYSSSRIQRSIKRLEKCGLLTAEKFKHGYLFTVKEAQDPTNDPQSLDITENKEETIEIHRHEKDSEIILPSGCESDINHLRASSENKKKNVKNEKKKSLSDLTEHQVHKLALITEHFLVRRGTSFSLSPVEQMSLERISQNERSADELKAFMDEHFERVKEHDPYGTIHTPKYLENALMMAGAPGARRDKLDEMLDQLEARVKQS